MAAAIVTDGGANIFGNAIEALHQLIDRKCLKIGMTLESLVQIGDIGVVMLAVMNFHRHAYRYRAPAHRGVRERGKNVGQRTLLL